MIDISLLTFTLLALTGVFAGFSAGLLGVGGGLIIVPALYFIYSLDAAANTPYLMHTALATSLATIVITSISSTLAHHKKGAVNWPIVFMLSPGICIGAWLGASTASILETDILRPVFGIFEISVGLLMLMQYQSKQYNLNISRSSTFAGGSVIGFISAIVGIGGGTMTVPFLHWHKINIKSAIATSAACGFPIALIGTLSYLYNSYSINSTTTFVDFYAFIIVSTCSFLIAPLGAATAHRFNALILKRVFSVLLLTLGIKMLFF